VGKQGSGNSYKEFSQFYNKCGTVNPISQDKYCIWKRYYRIPPPLPKTDLQKTPTLMKIYRITDYKERFPTGPPDMAATQTQKHGKIYFPNLGLMSIEKYYPDFEKMPTYLRKKTR
jgi:bisphosphoglycerate-dependent phosphoglycerate mutase